MKRVKRKDHVSSNRETTRRTTEQTKKSQRSSKIWEKEKTANWHWNFKWTVLRAQQPKTVKTNFQLANAEVLTSGTAEYSQNQMKSTIILSNHSLCSSITRCVKKKVKTWPDTFSKSEDRFLLKLIYSKGNQNKPWRRTMGWCASIEVNHILNLEML